MTSFDAARERGYETAGLRPTALLFGVAGVSLLIGSALAVSWLTIVAFDDFAGVSPKGRALVFPAPGVEPNQSFERRRHERLQRADLNSYGWADREAGVATIPIERAMAIMTEEHLEGLKPDGGERSSSRP